MVEAHKPASQPGSHNVWLLAWSGKPVVVVRKWLTLGLGVRRAVSPGCGFLGALASAWGFRLDGWLMAWLSLRLRLWLGSAWLNCLNWLVGLILLIRISL